MMDLSCIIVTAHSRLTISAGIAEANVFGRTGSGSIPARIVEIWREETFNGHGFCRAGASQETSPFWARVNIQIVCATSHSMMIVHTNLSLAQPCSDGRWVGLQHHYSPI
jgi:hypothetical protein